MEATTTKMLRLEALKNGAIWGAVNIVLLVAVWYIAPSLLSSYWYAGIQFVIGIALASFFCLDLRKKAGGYWSFSEALWPIFAMFLTNMALALIFTTVFGKFIDPSYATYMKEKAVESTVKMMETMGASQDVIDTQLEAAEERFEKQFNPGLGDFIQAFGITAIFYFIGALIFALIFKKTDPNPWASQEDEVVQG
ncbi:MAG: DUF4199 domain-containing protein [Pedobacter sp.]|nr:MAG: DUF4199 domain-containing protein [Pedobacter sp.]